MENVLVIGASTNEERISNTAIVRLVNQQHNVFAIGLKPGIVAGIEIKTGQPIFENIDTITMYVGAKNQPIFYDYILQIKPKRVIFNPGSENEELETLLHQNNIAFEQACTLVLLASGQF
jgi:predicted CoA-binding protein